MKNGTSKLFVLDTNILMHDPSALFQFKDNDVYLPMVVLEELDDHKTGLSEVARNVRQVNRMLMDLMTNASHEQIVQGLPLHHYSRCKNTELRGRLFFQTEEFEGVQSLPLPGHKVDNTLLATALALKQKIDNRQVVIISKDINLRIKAGILGIAAEDYYNDQVIEDVSLLHSGLHMLEGDFWDETYERHGSVERNR